MSGPHHQTLGLQRLPAFKPDQHERVWSSTPHPSLPLLASTYNKAVTIFSLSTLSSHSSLTGGHERSVRSASWKPGLPPHKLCLATASFDSTSAVWRWEQNVPFQGSEGSTGPESRETDVAAGDSDRDEEEGWQFAVVLEGQENEIKCVTFSPSGQYLATCGRDKSIWIWEDVGAADDDDEWETVAVLKEHDGDVKCIAWCPDVPGRNARGHYSAEVLASASYDNTIRIWREDGDGDWVCVSVLEQHDDIVWGVQWEPDPKNDKFPRLMSWSTDQTIRIWTRQDEDGGEESAGRAPSGGASLLRSGLGGIPNTMRRSLHEDWSCTAALPKVHTREIYSASWSGATGLVASTGGDGLIAVYAEDGENEAGEDHDVDMAEAAAELDGDAVAVKSSSDNISQGSKRWKILTTVVNGHGPYEINHITWCPRFDAKSEQRGVEEMLVTSGDDGVVVPWQVIWS